MAQKSAAESEAPGHEASGHEASGHEAVELEREQTTAATTAMLKAFTHPLRRQVMRLFPQHQYLRAADIAELLDVPANKVSFHLRALADAGLIVEAPERARDRRDRVWKGNKAALNIGGPESPIDDPALGHAVLKVLVDEHYDLVRRVVAWTPEYMEGRTTEVHGEFSQGTARLTEPEFRALATKFSAIMREATEAHDKAHPDGDGPDTRVWSIDIIAADDTI